MVSILVYLPLESRSPTLLLKEKPQSAKFALLRSDKSQYGHGLRGSVLDTQMTFNALLAQNKNFYCIIFFSSFYDEVASRLQNKKFQPHHYNFGKQTPITSFLLFPFPLDFGGLAFSLWFDLISLIEQIYTRKKGGSTIQIPEVDISTSAFFDHLSMT